MFDKLRDSSKIIVYIVVAAFIVTGGLMGFGSYMSDNTPQGGVSSNHIARVNDREISREEFLNALRNSASEASGLSSSQVIPFRMNVLNSIIERELLMQQAEEMGIEAEVSEEEVQDTIDEIISANEIEDREELVSVLEEQGSSLADFTENIRNSLESNQIIEKTVASSYENIEVTEEEIKEKYEGSESYQEEDYEEVKDEIEKELINQKQSAAYQDWFEDIRKEADVEIMDPTLAGYDALEDENYQQAIENFEVVLDNNPSAMIYNYLAQAYQGQGDMEKASEIYTEAIEEYPDDWELHYNFAELYRETEEEDQALDYLEQAAEKAGEDYMAHYRIFMAYNQLGAEDKAEKSLEKLNQIREEQMGEEAIAPEEGDEEEIEEELEETEEVEDVDDLGEDSEVNTEDQER
ncbi:MAG: SurA N-terminal domain-containing protein [Halanaerobiales bacterium]